MFNREIPDFSCAICWHDRICAQFSCNNANCKYFDRRLKRASYNFLPNHSSIIVEYQLHKSFSWLYDNSNLCDNSKTCYSNRYWDELDYFNGKLIKLCKFCTGIDFLFQFNCYLHSWKIIIFLGSSYFDYSFNRNRHLAIYDFISNILESRLWQPRIIHY